EREGAQQRDSRELIPAPAARRLAEARGFDFPASVRSVRPCSLARTTPRASCLTLGVLSLVLRVPQHTPYPYIYQMIAVCTDQRYLTVAFIGFSRDAIDRVFRMPLGSRGVRPRKELAAGSNGLSVVQRIRHRFRQHRPSEVDHSQ